MTRSFGAVAVLAAGLAAAMSAIPPAAADPVPPADPAIPIPGEAPPPPDTLRGQAAAAVGQTDPVAALSQLFANSPQAPAVGLSPLPPGTDNSGPAPDPMALTGLLAPQNFRMPTDDQISPYPLAPNSTPSPFARIDAWKGVHALTHGGLGRMPGADLGQPLPGTAAPPGSNLPPGLEQFYVDPALIPVDPAAPPAG